MEYHLSQAEENYLKAIFHICFQEEKAATTNAIATIVDTTAASVSDMLKRLAANQWVHYQSHRGVTLTNEGKKIATMLVRKHRLWEMFLVEVLNFSWDEVHDLAEQLEHVQSDELIERLDAFLGRPKFDPHGDPIPDAEGNFAQRLQMPLSALRVGEWGVIVGVLEQSAAFLRYLDRMNLGIGAQVEVREIFEFDGSLQVQVKGKQLLTISSKVSENLLAQKIK
ncbi:MAG: metal-dependent transcriptional regulator [Lewinellaceae bacterium]|nr:metal-dependent transcriptional regulator [Saprospiraceae bacterium]MCB9337197.1 metal-dependent transcriptional regulator [Lewinellaceae bacterium]